MKAGTAAKLIVDALLQRFLPLARRRIETAQAQVLFAHFSVCLDVNLLSLMVNNLILQHDRNYGFKVLEKCV